MQVAVSLPDLVPDLFFSIASLLSIYDVCALAQVSTRLRSLSDHPFVWRLFSLTHFGVQSLDAFPKTNAVGVTPEDFRFSESGIQEISEKISEGEEERSWRNFFRLMYSSEVYTWGEGSEGRLGHGNTEFVGSPKLVRALKGKSIKYLGKTAEVGSCAFSFSGKRFYLWGTRERCTVPCGYDVGDYSTVPGDHVVHISCGHDSGFLIVLASGRVLSRIDYVRSPLVDISEALIVPHLLPNEKPIWSIGSQAGLSGVVTNKNRVIAWDTDTGNRFAKQWQLSKEGKTFSTLITNSVFVVPPIDPKTGEHFEVKKVAFGHSHWFAIGPSQQLYWIELSKFYSVAVEVNANGEKECNFWKSMPGTKNLKIVDVDSGTRHSGFITDTGDVYTWGGGRQGCLGHNSEDDEKVPRRVEYFTENHLKAVSIGCGGYMYWNGGFTLVLVEDNRLYCCGNLGVGSEYQLIPKQVIIPNTLILSISAGEDWAGIVTCSNSSRQIEEDSEPQEIIHNIWEEEDKEYEQTQLDNEDNEDNDNPPISDSLEINPDNTETPSESPSQQLNPSDQLNPSEPSNSSDPPPSGSNPDLDPSEPPKPANQ